MRDPEIIIASAQPSLRGPSSSVHWDVSFGISNPEVWQRLAEEIEAMVVAAASKEFADCQSDKITLTIELHHDKRNWPLFSITGQVDLVPAVKSAAAG